VAKFHNGRVEIQDWFTEGFKTAPEDFENGCRRVGRALSNGAVGFGRRMKGFGEWAVEGAGDMRKNWHEYRNRSHEKAEKKKKERELNGKQIVSNLADIFGAFGGFVAGKSIAAMYGDMLHLYIKESKDPSIVTFQYHGGVALNKSNTYVSDMIKENRADMLLPDIIRQIVRNYGYYQGSKLAGDAERRILLGVNLRLAQKEIVRTEKVENNGLELILPPMRFSEDELKKSGLRKGQLAQVIVTPSDFTGPKLNNLIENEEMAAPKKRGRKKKANV
jgi:hypothetical protein